MVGIGPLLQEIKEQARKKGYITERELALMITKADLPAVLKAAVFTELNEMEICVVEKDLSVAEPQDNQTEKMENNHHEENKSRLKRRLDGYLNRREEYSTEDGDIIKSEFFADLSRPRMQYTYFPLVLLAFFGRENFNEQMSMTDMVHFFGSFYQDRKLKGLVVEKVNSIFVKKNPTDVEIKRLILSNPLGRSCLVKYFKYDKKSDFVSLNKKLYASLSVSDVEKIVKLATELIQGYYMKLN